MAYINRMISHGETLIGVSRLHWIYLAEGFFWLVGLMAAGFLFDAGVSMALGAILPGVNWGFMNLQTTWLETFFIIAGLYIFTIYFIKVATTEVGLTSQRVIHKQGWLFVKVTEINLEEIKGSHIDLGMLGRFLGYGSIALDARFVKDTNLPFINQPYRFTKAMNEAQEALEQHLSLAIDGRDGVVHLRPAKNVEQPPEPERNQPSEPRPAAQAHAVAEGSYEEAKLKEELMEEFSQTIDPESDDSSMPSRRLH